MHALEDAAHQVWAQALAQYRAEASRQEWSPEWTRAAESGDYPVRTTPAGLTALMDELREVIARHSVDDAPDAETVLVLLQAFSRRS